MPSNEEIEAATKALIDANYPNGDYYERTAFDDTHVYRSEAKAALEAAEKVRGDEVSKLKEENERLRDGITKTIEENLHLADGDVCTLIPLKKALEPKTKG